MTQAVRAGAPGTVELRPARVPAGPPAPDVRRGRRRRD
ncbi:hypothetical protein SLI_6080 [Streptomyces lividans 1326]|uniref:Uncharacterized protein n=1 Tax=Streptomyces lividans 1326 TaxID=1200984 RepID=A0A7U9DV94_STRLI|nr:hypothetical protein SLI_6080 [Streptomyces lividans 1326]